MRAACAAGLLAMTGCASVYHVENDEAFSSAPLTAGTPVPLQVDGVVGGMQGEPLAQAVAAAMPPVGGPNVQYAPCEAYTECPGDHLVWTFGPPAWRPASAYPPAISRNIDWIGNYRPAPNNIAAKLALFENGQVVGSASGQVDADSPSDPAFQAMVASMTRQVLSGPGFLDPLL